MKDKSNRRSPILMRPLQALRPQAPLCMSGAWPGVSQAPIGDELGNNTHRPGLESKWQTTPKPTLHLFIGVPFLDTGRLHRCFRASTHGHRAFQILSEPFPLLGDIRGHVPNRNVGPCHRLYRKCHPVQSRCSTLSSHVI